MTFKNYIAEAVIVPKKLTIKTTDIKKLNKQFKDTIVSFEYDTGEHAAYLPQLSQIKVYITKATPHNTIEALLQHELIHLEQDKKSGMRMQADIEKSHQIVQNYLDDLEEFEDEIPDEVAADMLKQIDRQRVIAQHLNDEERMTYAMMFVKLRKTENIHQLIKDANEMWKVWTNEKMNNKMLKYIYSYWLVKDEL